MTPVETAVEFFKKVEEAQWHEVAALLTPDFLYFGPLPEPVNKETWLDLQESIRIACPDWSFHLSEAVQQGNTVRTKVHIIATQTAPLDLSAIGLGTIPASGLRVELPDETATLIFKGGLICELHVSPELHGGLMSLLSQLGLS